MGKPTPGEMRKLLGECQDLFGGIEAAYLNDRAVDRTAVATMAQAGFRKCVNLLSRFPPDRMRRPPPLRAGAGDEGGDR